jgi:hypothetical protein
MQFKKVDAQIAVVGRPNGLGAVLIEVYEVGAEHPIKTDMLDQVVSIVRRIRGPDERAREIANLIRSWKQMRDGRDGDD